MAQPLPVILPSVRGQRFACAGCTNCCRELVVHLFAADVERIDGQRWRDTLGTEPYVRLGRSWVLNQRPDGACVFLNEDGRCMIHVKHGYTAKPLACQIFPFTLRRHPGWWQGGVRFDCPTVARSQGEPLKAHREDLKRLAGRLFDHLPVQDDGVDLRAGLAATADEVGCVSEAMERWMQDGSRTLGRRLRGGAWITEHLRRAKLANVRGDRFAELVGLLFGYGTSELDGADSLPAGGRARKLLRQLVYAYGQSATLRQAQAAWWAKAAIIWRQMRESRRYRRGRGPVPADARPGIAVRFEHVETVRPACGTDSEAITELVVRYVRTRLLSRSVCGMGYYKWPLFDGLSALWLGVVVLAWQARLVAARDGRDRLTHADVLQAVRTVDRAVGRVPALGTTAERLRTRYLTSDGGLQRLFTSYPLVEE